MTSNNDIPFVASVVVPMYNKDTGTVCGTNFQEMMILPTDKGVKTTSFSKTHRTLSAK